MKTKIITPLMALALLLASCGETTTPRTPVPDVLSQGKINPSEVFTVSRTGERVHIQWTPDFSGCKGIIIYRNGTGFPQNRYKAASLPGTSKDYDDSVPDANAYWYWLYITLPNNKVRNIGPLRAPPDAEKAGKYAPVNNSTDVQLAAQRDDSSVTIAWLLPDIKYTSIQITRNSSPKYSKAKNPRKIILKTLESSGELTDKLPDAGADYWYWIEAVRENGAILDKGPIKAVYAGEGDVVAPTPASQVKAKTKGTPKGKGPGRGPGKGLGKGKGMGVPKMKNPDASGGVPNENQTTNPVGFPQPNEENNPGASDGGLHGNQAPDSVGFPKPSEEGPDVMGPDEE